MLIEKCKWYEKVLNEAQVRVYGDYRENYSPGWKFNHWELKGVPVRLEIGPKDLAKKTFIAVRRDTGVKREFNETDAVSEIKKLFVQIHEHLYRKAEKDLEAHLVVEDTWCALLKGLDSNKLIMAPFCGEKPCEDKIKKDSARDAVVEEGAPAMGAKGLCIPFDQPREIKGKKCVHPECNKEAKYYTLFGRSY
jgi:bifunctional glutamyl/prolyl-tRNA synthetase